MSLENDNIRGILTPFMDTLKDPAGFSEQTFFDGREALKQVFDRVQGKPQAQAFWSIQAMLGGLIRKGHVDQLTALTAIGSLLESLVEWAESSPGGSKAFSLAPPLPGEAPQAKNYLRLANGPLPPVSEQSPVEPPAPAAAPSGFVPVHENCLGQLLVQTGKLTNTDLSRALDLQKINGRRLGEVLIAMEAVGIQTLEEALVRQKFLASCKTAIPTTVELPRLRLDR